MAITTDIELRGPIGLDAHGLAPSGGVTWNPSTSQLYLHALLRGEGQLAEGGALVVDTGHHTGRSPNDKFVVREPESEDRIDWGSVNRPIDEERFEGLRAKVARSEQDQELYVVDAFAGADPAYRLPSASSPARGTRSSPKTLFIDPTEEEIAAHVPEALVLHAPPVEASPEEDGTRSGTFVCLHPSRREVVIGGTFYAGEIKKSIFTLMNDLLPLRGVLPMHCSANVGEDGRPPCSSASRARGRRLCRPIRAASDRRRRARLVRRRRVQLRGRLLRQGDPAVRGGRAGDLPHDAHGSGRCSRT